MAILAFACGIARSDEFTDRQNGLDRASFARRTANLRVVDSLAHLVSVEGPGCRAERFIGPGMLPWIMVTNTDSATGHYYRLTFDHPVTLFQILPVTGLERRLGRRDGHLFYLRAGAAALFRYHPGAEAHNMKPRVMLNPSVQYNNVILDDNGTEIYNEGETMWDVTSRVKTILDTDGRIDAYISRLDRRTHSSIQLECTLAQQLTCDAFVSLHSDATADGTEGGGTWTFFADDQGKRLGECVQGKVLSAIREVYPEVIDRGVKEHWNRLYVLHNSGCAASLTEILFHSNPKEREMLKNSAFQDRVAKAVARGILEYFGFES